MSYTETKRATFGARARVIDLLGREQISDAPTAISELLKNSVDALASHATVRYNSHKGFLTLDDDGLGMRRDDLLNKWLVIATDSKRGELDKSYYEFADKARLIKAEQHPSLGEKGIGRLAVAALGRGVLVWTRWGEGEKAQRTLLFIHWHLFRHPRLGLDDIIVPYRELGERAPTQDDIIELFGDLEEWMQDNAEVWQTEEEKRLETEILADLGHAFLDCLEEDLHFALHAGTLFCVLGTEPEVDGVFADQIVAGEEKRAVEGEGIRLLLGFCDPFGVYGKRLQVDFFVDDRTPEAERDFWTKADFRKVDHEIEFDVDEKGFVKGTVRRYDQVIQYQYQTPKFLKSAALPGPFHLHLGYVHGNKEDSRMSEEEFYRYNERVRAYGSLYVYRDGIRVLPYGRIDNDFLGFEERRSRNAGRYFFSHRRMFGGIYLTKTGNPKLQDKAGREGFIRNPAYRGLVAILSEVFIDLALSLFGRESDRPDQVEQRAKRQNAISQQQERAKSALTNFKRDLTLWKRRLPVLEDQTRDSISQAARALDLASHSTPGSSDAQAMLARCSTAVESVRRQISQAEQQLGTDVPAIVTLKRDMADDFDRYLSQRAQWQGRATRELGRLAATYEKLAARHRTEQERLEAVQQQINATQTETQALLQNEFQKFQDVCRAVLNDRSRTWLAGQQMRLADLLTDALGDDAAAQVVADAEGAKAIILERTLSEIRRTTQEELIPFWDTVTKQLGHLDDTEAGELALGALNREVEQLRESERQLSELAQLGLIVESLDHEYNVLFDGIQKSLRAVEQRLKDDERGSQSVAQLRLHFDSLLLKFSVISPLYRRKLGAVEDLAGTEIREFLERFHPEERRGDVTITYSKSFLSTVLPQVNGSVVLAATLNIVNNAFHWTKESNNPREVRFTPTERGFVISDSGPGVSPRDRNRVFDAFFSRRPDGRGLGLHIAKVNLAACGLELYLAEEPLPRALSGANFVIRQREE